MPKDWKKEIARDTAALGSIPFYFVVVMRAVIGRYAPFILQLLIPLAVLVIAARLIKFNHHIARGLILVVFSSLFYKDIPYTVFVSLLWLVMILCLHYLKVKHREIGIGIALGAVSAVISYYAVPLLV